MNNQTKRKIYIALFIFLGFLLGLLIHGFLEIWYIKGLISNFPKYSLGFSWADWFTIHKIFSGFTFIGGVLFGYFQGRFWWRTVYEQKRFGSFFTKFKKFLYGGG
ncbi:MAG: hypothetical protein AAB410_01905 [Patescibacteria group bacterium]